MNIRHKERVPDLVSGKDAEGMQQLLRGLHIRILSCDEVKESLKADVALVVGVDERHDSLEVSLALSQSQRATHT